MKEPRTTSKDLQPLLPQLRSVLKIQQRARDWIKMASMSLEEKNTADDKPKHKHKGLSHVYQKTNVKQDFWGNSFRENILLTDKLQAELSFLIQHIVRTGSSEPETSLSYTAIGLGCSGLPIMH